MIVNRKNKFLKDQNAFGARQANQQILNIKQKLYYALQPLKQRIKQHITTALLP